jgi:hypothetical protein
VGDWKKDLAVRSVSLAARGLWMEMLCAMHDSEQRGCLVHANGRPVTTEQLARMAGCSVDDAGVLLDELLDAGVCSVDERGVVYCRRMVREAGISETRSEVARKGATSRERDESGAFVKNNHSGQQTTSKRPSKTPEAQPANDPAKPEQKPRPSSSSSTASSSSPSGRAGMVLCDSAAPPRPALPGAGEEDEGFRSETRPPEWCDPDTWLVACRLADQIEQADTGEAVVGARCDERAMHLARLLEDSGKPGVTDLGVGNITEAIGALVRDHHQDSALRGILVDLQRFPDGAYPNKVGNRGGASRIEQAWRRMTVRRGSTLTQARARRGGGFTSVGEVIADMGLSHRAPPYPQPDG